METYQIWFYAGKGIQRRELGCIEVQAEMQEDAELIAQIAYPKADIEITLKVK